MITRFYCKQCGSENIQVLAWYDPNEDRVGDFYNECECWCEKCEDRSRWDTKLVITPREAKNITLEDDDTTLGGVSRFGETLAEFMESAQIPYTTAIEDIDEALKECGIKPIFE